MRHRLLPGNIRRAPGMMRPMGDISEFTLETFAPRVGETFRLQLADAATLELVLADASAPESAAGAEEAGLRSPFSIVLRGPLQPLLPQQMYSFAHDELGDFDLFIVPVAQDESGTQYEAVFG